MVHENIRLSVLAVEVKFRDFENWDLLFFIFHFFSGLLRGNKGFDVI